MHLFLLVAILLLSATALGGRKIETISGAVANTPDGTRLFVDEHTVISVLGPRVKGPDGDCTSDVALPSPRAHSEEFYRFRGWGTSGPSTGGPCVARRASRPP